jgi:hypothetical protein
MPQHFRSLLIASTSITDEVSTRVHYNKNVPPHYAKPFVWFRVNTDNEELTLDGTGGIHEANIDLEIVGESEGDAQGAADDIKAKLHGYKGTVGTSTGSVSGKATFVEDKDDDYVPYNNRSNTGAHIVAFNVRLFYST